MSTTKNYTISIEGNIGCGKSTVLSQFINSPLYEIIPEPVGKWTNFHGFNLLEMFYEDQQRWAFLFELNALRTLAEIHTQRVKKPIKVLERSILCTRRCFMENIYRAGNLEEVEYRMLDDEYQKLTANNSCHVDLIIYLRTTPEVCMKRIQARNRSEEASKIDLGYLTTLHQLHEDWLYGHNGRDSTNSSDVIVIGANQDREQVYTTINNQLSHPTQ